MHDFACRYLWSIYKSSTVSNPYCQEKEQMQLLHIVWTVYVIIYVTGGACEGQSDKCKIKGLHNLSFSN